MASELQIWFLHSCYDILSVQKDQSDTNCITSNFYPLYKACFIFISIGLSKEENLSVLQSVLQRTIILYQLSVHSRGPWPIYCLMPVFVNVYFIGTQPHIFACYLQLLSSYNIAKQLEKDPMDHKANIFTVYSYKDVCQLLIYDIKSNLKTMSKLKLR